MRKLLLLFFFGAAFQKLFGQSKLNFGAALVSKDFSKSEALVPLLVRGDIGQIKRMVEETGGEFRTSAGDIASLAIKGKHIELFASKPFVKRIEGKNPHSKMQPLHDSMLVNNRVMAVHQGVSPLLKAYKGKDVVVGIIDTGIDFTHDDFQDSTGKTRIKFIWDQVLSTSNPPAPWNYGRQYTSNAIDNNFANAHLATAATYGGHGTHVASEASGNGLAINKYEAVAPESDIIFVAYDFNNPNGIVDGVDYIYQKAAALGKPCVINCSLGDYYGSHDGLDLQAQAIKALITAQPGRSLVAAAGNGGTSAFHLGYTVQGTDTNFTWFSGAAYIAMYADSNDFKNIQFSIGADVPGPNYSFRGNIPFSTISSHIGVLKNDTIWNGNNRIATILSYGDSVNGVYSMEFTITPDSAYLWRLMTTGSGKFDEWSFDVVTANLADTVVYPALKKYKQPDLDQTIVSSFQCLNEVIAVGNYLNRNQHLDYDSIMQVDNTIIPGSLEASSSRGPTRDGRIKPEITSPGNYVIGSMVASLFNNFSHSVIAAGGKHRKGSGTSAAAPCVAGIAALYLELSATADWQEIKDAITNCARQDSFTGTNLPNNTWGYGKADAFATLTSCTTPVAQHSPSLTGLLVYPNPASGVVNIKFEFPGDLPVALLKIHDAVGRKIYSTKIKPNEMISLNTKQIPGGIYFCTVSEGRKIIAAQKLIISD